MESNKMSNYKAVQVMSDLLAQANEFIDRIDITNMQQFVNLAVREKIERMKKEAESTEDG